MVKTVIDSFKNVVFQIVMADVEDNILWQDDDPIRDGCVSIGKRVVPVL